MSDMLFLLKAGVCIRLDSTAAGVIDLVCEIQPAYELHLYLLVAL